MLEVKKSSIIFNSVHVGTKPQIIAIKKNKSVFNSKTH